MVGAVGSDSHGDLLKANLASYFVDASSVAALPAPVKTGVAVIIVDEPTGENRIILSGEANHLVAGHDYVSRALNGADLLIMQLEIPLPTVLEALGRARQRGVKVLLNPAPAQKLPLEAYDGLAHLVVNETEAAILGEVDEKDLDAVEGLEKVGKKFLGFGVENVVITLGGRGVYYLNKEGKGGLVEAEKGIKVVDTTAAGDTFVGRYALDVVDKGGFDIETAVRKANKAAAITVQRAGAQDSIPWRDEVE